MGDAGWKEVSGTREVAKAQGIRRRPPSPRTPLLPSLAQPAARSRTRKVAQSSQLPRAEWLAARSVPAPGPQPQVGGAPRRRPRRAGGPRARPRSPTTLPAAPLAVAVLDPVLGPPGALQEPLLPAAPALREPGSGIYLLGVVTSL